MDAKVVKAEADRIIALFREDDRDGVVEELSKMPPLRVACVVAHVMTSFGTMGDGDRERFAGLLEYRTGPETGFDLTKVGVPLYVVDEHGVVSPVFSTTESDTGPETMVASVGAPVGELRRSLGLGGGGGWLPFSACK